MADLVRGVSTNALDTTYIRRRAIKTLVKKLVLANHVTEGELPKGEGSTLRWTYDTNLSNANAFNALTDDAGTPITYATRDSFNEEAFATTKVEKQIDTYGVFIPVRRRDLDQMPKSTMDRLSKRVAYRGHEVKDTLLRAAADGSGTGFNPSMGAGTTTTRKSIGDGTNDAVLSATDYLTAEDIMLAMGDLEANDAEGFEGDGQMRAVIHSGAATHLKTDVSASRVTWFEAVKHVSGFTGQERFLTGVIGSLGGTSVQVSNNITTSTQDTRSAYDNLVLASDGLGDVTQAQSKPTVHVNRSAPSSMSDPHRMWATVAFNFQGGPTLIDSNRLLKLWSTV